jgi:ribosomal protein S12 methylthiotransferase
MHCAAIITLGCPKNQVDSEMIKGLLIEKGYRYVDRPEKADIIVVNTCGFIQDAKQESINTLLEIANYKKEGRCTLLVATGCLTQRYGRELLREIPEIDVVLGTTSFPGIVRAVDESLMGKRVLDIGHRDAVIPEGLPRSTPKGAHYEYLKIAEGCDNHCSYCIIPKLRGKYRCRREEDIIREAKRLVSGKVRELILIAQDTTGYGRDLYDEMQLPKLLDRLCGIEGLNWIRLLYCYPDGITGELINTIERQPNICKYLDIPVQHASDRILRLMNRRTTAARTEKLLSSIRERLPGLVIRSTVIVGFPGETDQDFESVLTFVRRGYFDRLGVFTYSREEDTPAYNMKDRVPQKLAEERKEILMLEQQRISLKNNASMVGHEVEVIVDGRDDCQYYGRTYRDAPEIDNLVLFTSDMAKKAGDFARVRIEHAFEYDLVGRVVG